MTGLRALESMSDLDTGASENALVMFEPSVWAKQDEKLMFNSFLTQAEKYTQPQASTWKASCKRVPEVCARLGEFPTNDPIFAWWLKRSHEFVKYLGPKSMDKLAEFISAKPSTPQDRPRQMSERKLNRRRRKRVRKQKQASNPGAGREVHDVMQGRPRNPHEVYIDTRVDGSAEMKEMNLLDFVGGVYVYNETWARLPRGCKKGENDVPESIRVTGGMADAGYHSITGNWIADTERAGLRVNDPTQAQWFFVPFDVDASFALGECVDDNLQHSTHLERVHNLLDGLTASAYFKKYGGSNHVVALMHFAFEPWRRLGSLDPKRSSAETYSIAAAYFPANRIEVVQNMVIARPHNLRLKLPTAPLKRQSMNISKPKGFKPQVFGGGSVWWVEGEDWRCTVTLPVRTPNMLLLPNSLKTFEFSSWKSRPHLLHYRGRQPQQCRSHAQPLNDVMSKLGYLFPGSIIEANPAPRDTYAEELRSSKFCLVLRCDYAYRSRLYDAVAAGCIPVLINDGWHLTVAPFAEGGFVQYSDFVISIPESMFLEHPPSALSYIYTMSESRMQRMHEHMLKARPSVVWGLAGILDTHEGVRSIEYNSVGALAWQTIAQECAL